MKWAYGVTTVADRFSDLLPRTLKSLATAGFDTPRLFVDGLGNIPDQYKELQRYEATFHYPRVRTFANWWLALWELYLRDPHADRYAIFQDDFVTYKNLRSYLEECHYPRQGYLNLYTFPENNKQYRGWYCTSEFQPGLQRGLGAVGLVFSNEAVRVLLKQEYMVERPQCPNKGWRAIDGGIVSAFNGAGWQEWVHNPSLLQHTGDTSTMENGYQPKASTFMGENFDAMDLFDNKPLTPPTLLRAAPGPNRIGLVGYNCNSGLGELNRQIASYSEIDVWLVKPHPHYGTNAPHPAVETVVCKMGQTPKIEKFLQGVDTVVFCETPYYTELTDLARQHKKRTVCIPMMEWMPSGAKGWPRNVDLFICPTKDCYNQFANTVPCVYFPWPVDTERFQFKQRSVCNKFLFLGGHGGFGGRKGVSVMQRAKQLWPEMPLIVSCQDEEVWPKGTRILAAAQENSALYDEGDVLIVPHSVDGLGLEPMEAMSCGMPVISTDGNPWNEIPSIGKIAAEESARKVQRPVTWYLPSPESVVSICKALLGQDISTQSKDARLWAEDRCWSKLVGSFNDLVRTGVPVGKEPVNA